jgi:hypothetical protein
VPHIAVFHRLLWIIRRNELRTELLTVATPTFAVFWKSTLCSLVGIHRHSRVFSCLHYQGKWNVGTFTQYYTTSHPKILVVTQLFSSQSSIICSWYLAQIYQMLVLCSFIDYVLSYFVLWFLKFCAVDCIYQSAGNSVENESLLYLI